MRVSKIITAAFFIMALLGCATTKSSVVITGQIRPAVSPNVVRVYIEPPSRYETIGVIEAFSEIDFSRQAAQDRVIYELKLRAAKMGANGVVLVSSGNKSGGTALVPIGSMFYAISSEKITAQGKAIYVIEE